MCVCGGGRENSIINIKWYSTYSHFVVFLTFVIQSLCEMIHFLLVSIFALAVYTFNQPLRIHCMVPWIASTRPSRGLHILTSLTRKCSNARICWNKNVKTLNSSVTFLMASGIDFNDSLVDQDSDTSSDFEKDAPAAPVEFQPQETVKNHRLIKNRHHLDNWSSHMRITAGVLVLHPCNQYVERIAEQRLYEASYPARK